MNALRQQILNELAEDREAIRSAVDLVQILADLAVAAARQAEVAKLTQARQHIETLYQTREAGYLKEEQDWKQFVQNAQSILETAAKEWNELRVKAQSALEQADQDQLRYRNLALAKEQQRFREHIDRWKRDLEDLRTKGPSIDGEVLIDRIQLVLDFAGFIPVLGAGPDAINAMISAGRGNWGSAAINLIAIIPLWGDGVKAGKMLAKAGQEGLSHVDEVGGAVNAVAKNRDLLKEGGKVLEHTDELHDAIRAGDEYQQYSAAVNDYLTHIDELKAAAKKGDQTAIDALRDMKNDGLFEKMRHLIEEHHAWPQYLGGSVRQELVKMPTWLHTKYHTLLDDIAPRWKNKEYFDNLSIKERAALDKAFAELTKKFDAIYGTELWQALLRNGFRNQ